MTAGESQMIRDVIAREPRLSIGDDNFITMLGERDPEYYTLKATELRRLVAIHGATK